MADSFFQKMQKSSHLAGQSAAYIESLYEVYLDDPSEVSDYWREYFEKLPRVDGVLGADTPHTSVVKHFERLGKNRLKAKPEKVATNVSSEHESKQMRVQDLIASYRSRGHKRANIDPLGIMERPYMPNLELAYHHLSDADLEETFQTGGFHYEDGIAKLSDLIVALESTYCSSIGAEYMHIVDPSEHQWVQQSRSRLKSLCGKRWHGNTC